MIQPGSKFRFLHQKGGGTVYSQNANGKYHVELDEGFFADVHPNEIVEIKIDFSALQTVKNKDAKGKTTSNLRIAKRPKNEPVLDLHLNDKNTYSNCLETQITYLKSWLADCIKSKINSATIIHGDGEGILKKEVHLVLKSSSYIKEIAAANVFAHGTGATKIVFKYY